MSQRYPSTHASCAKRKRPIPGRGRAFTKCRPETPSRCGQLANSCNDHICLACIPGNRSSKSPHESHRPKPSGSLVRRASEDGAVVHDKYIIGMTAPAGGRRIAPDGWNVVGNPLRVVLIRDVNALEPALFPGAPNNIPLYEPLDIVNAHSSSGPIRRTIPM